jgi:hypothetical protein
MRRLSFSATDGRSRLDEEVIRVRGSRDLSFLRLTERPDSRWLAVADGSECWGRRVVSGYLQEDYAIQTTLASATVDSIGVPLWPLTYLGPLRD